MKEISPDDHALVKRLQETSRARDIEGSVLATILCSKADLSPEELETIRADVAREVKAGARKARKEASISVS